MNNSQNYPENDIFQNINDSNDKIPEIQKNLNGVYNELAKLKFENNTDIDKLKEGFDKYKKLYDQFIESRNSFQMDLKPFVYISDSNFIDSFDEVQFKKELLSGLMDVSQIDNYKEKIVIINTEIDAFLKQIDTYKQEIETYNDTIRELIEINISDKDIKYKLESEITEYDYVDQIEKIELNNFIFNDNEKFNNFITFLDTFVNKLKQLKNENELDENKAIITTYNNTLKQIDSIAPITQIAQIAQIAQINKTQIIESYKNQLIELDKKINVIDTIDTSINHKLKKNYEIKKEYINKKLIKLGTVEQLGGDIFEMTDSTQQLMEIIKKVDIINIKLKEIKDLNKMALNIKSRIMMYKTYLILVIQNEFNKKQSIIYKYINRGLIQYYLSVILSIEEKFNINADNVNSGIEFFNKFHYISIKKFKRFFKLLLDLPSFTTDKIIDIEKSNDNIKLLFTLFNNFKDLLDSYNEQFQNKITIYARINDKTPSANPLFESSPDDSRILLVNKKNCPNIGQYSSQQIQFTEVFDSYKFKETLTISKYMTLASQISKGKGILFLTYGYSGTGKTFTLFGTKEKQGLLQSTLLNINNIQKVLFRVYEIYGEGISTSDYWNNFDSYDIIKYNLNIEQRLEMKSGDITIEKYISIVNNDTVKRSERKQYLNDGQDFVILSHDQKDMKNIFKNFSQFIDDLDEMRKKEKRIVATKNNPASSRSIIVYEFFNVVNDNTIVPFILIDLPGREEITPTYYDEFIATNSNIDSINKVRLKAAMLNPLYLSFLDERLTNTLIIDKPINLKNKMGLVFDKINSFIQQKDLLKLKDYIVEYLNNTQRIPINKDYFDLIYSGYFINENIIGLIKIIMVDLLKKKDIQNNIIFLQSDKLKSDKIKTIIDDSFDDYYIHNKDKKIYNENIKKFETLLETTNILDEDYDSKKIFNYSEPILLDLLTRYSKTHEFNPKNMNISYLDFNKPLNVLSVDSFKIFYLFTNDDADKKCHHQYKLLSNTLNLIYALKE